MSEEERIKCHADLVEKAVGKKMVPIYWMIGGTMAIMLTIFVTIALPISAQVIKLTEAFSNIEIKLNDKVNSNEAYENFLPKGQYHILQKDEHIADIEAIRNPENADVIYMKSNSMEAERLGIASRGSKDDFYKKDYNKVKNETN